MASASKDTWLGKRCPVCGQPHHRKKYCSESCRLKAARERNRAKYQADKKSGTALRIKTQKLQPRGCTIIAAGQPSVSEVGISSPPPFPEKQTRAGGNLTQIMYCEEYKQLITAEICRQRQRRLESSGNYIDIYCTLACKGTKLRPATRAEQISHQDLIRRVIREKGLEEMIA